MRLHYPAIKFRGRVFVGAPYHADAIEKAFDGMSQHQRGRVCDRIISGKEAVVFGFAQADGTDWFEADNQSARMRMYFIGI